MLPVGGVLSVVFAGWVMCRNSTADELGAMVEFDACIDSVRAEYESGG